jgi:GH24 family phage-related lysozyme (muramidase)
MLHRVRGKGAASRQRWLIATVAVCAALVAAAQVSVSAANVAADAATTVAARGSTCARLAAGSSLPCGGANSITAGEENQIAREEAPGGKPVLKPYNDSEGHCTIGIGHLIHKGKCTARDFQDWKGVTAAQLIALFHKDIAQREDELNVILIARLRLRLNPCQYDALFDLYFNGGPSWFGPRTPLFKALQARDMHAVPAIIASDVPRNASGTTKKVITARRKREAARFATPHCACKHAPVSGTFGGTFDQSPLGLVSWSGSVRFARLGFDLRGSAQFFVTSGDVSWKLSPAPGALPPGCKWLVLSGSFSGGDKFFGNIDLFPSYYFVQLGPGISGKATPEVSYTCGTGPIYTPVGNWYLLTANEPYKLHHGMNGTYAHPHLWPDNAWHWKLSFDTMPPVTV